MGTAQTSTRRVVRSLRNLQTASKKLQPRKSAGSLVEEEVALLKMLHDYETEFGEDLLETLENDARSRDAPLFGDAIDRKRDSVPLRPVLTDSQGRRLQRIDRVEPADAAGSASSTTSRSETTG